jgi:sec-independent protein translocase protein TatB
MLPDFGLVELLVIGAVALIVVGPKDLPKVMRQFGQFVGRMRAMAREFQNQFDEIAREAELQDLRDEVKRLRKEADPSEDLRNAMREAEDAWREDSDDGRTGRQG